jgi:hypothetical protein
MGFPNLLFDWTGLTTSLLVLKDLFLSRHSSVLSWGLISVVASQIKWQHGSQSVTTVLENLKCVYRLVFLQLF